MPIQTTGFRDWARVSEQAGTQLQYIHGVQINTDPTTGIFDTTGYAYLTTTVVATASAIFAVEYTWYQDEAGTIPLCTRIWVPVVASSTTKQTPVISRWVKITMFWYLNGGTETPQMLVFGCNDAAGLFGGEQQAYPFIYDGSTIGASGTSTTQAGVTYEGSAVWSVTQGSTNKWYAQLQFYNTNTFAWTAFAFMFGSIVGIGGIQSVALPPAPIQQVIVNQDTVSHAFFASLCLSTQ